MPNWKKIVTSGSDAALNSLSVTNGITGSLLGTASNATSASYVNPLNQLVIITGSLIQGQAGNVASGNYSHAEGSSTIASGDYSHAEGFNSLANGLVSHAEGFYTTASGDYSHAEGAITRALGSYSHAEGASTIASGNYSHAEGFFTVAQGNFQHVQGQYNISSSVQSAFIVGNGTDNNNRRNLIYAAGTQVEITGSLTVSSSNATQLQVGSNLLFVSSSGNVGIGTSTPNSKLEVNGNTTITGSLIVTGSASDVFAVNITGSRKVMRVGPTPGTFTGTVLDINSGYVTITGQVSNGIALDVVPGGLFGIRTYGGTNQYSFLANRANNSTQVLRLGGDGTVTIGNVANSSTHTLQIRGFGSGSVTNAIYVSNLATSASFIVQDDRAVLIPGTITVGSLITSSFTLNVAGATRLSGSFNTSTSGSILTVIGSGSAQPIFTVQGSQGELFSVTDSLSGSLFSVNDISGLPIMEVFSDNTILMGDYQDPMLLTTKKIVQTNSGSFVAYSIPTSSYDGAFIDYVIKSGSNARAGTIMSTWVGSSIEFTEVDTMDIGSTTAVGLTMILSGSNAVLTGSSSTGTWTIRTIVRAI